MNILVTGASGFIGSALVSSLSDKKNLRVISAVRQQSTVLCSDAMCIEVGSICKNTNWSNALDDVQVVIHTAAHAHVINDSFEDSLSQFRKVNVEGTVNLARQAVKAGVKRFIFISSIGVNGNINDHPFTEDDSPNPINPYAISKYEAESGLLQIAQEGNMEVVIIRPPLVYGANAPGNFCNLMKWMARGVMLPLGSIYNKRTFIALDNLIDFIITCVNHPAAADQIFLAGDSEDLSTTELLQRLGKALGRPTRLIPLPASLLIFVAGLLGKKATAQRLCGSLQVDISKAREVLDWMPPITVDEGIRRAVEGFKE